MGNMFARRPGRDPNRLPVLIGSHLDSQPSGGKFDGAPGRDRRAGGDAQPERPGHHHGSADRAGELDRRGRRALRPQPDGLRRLGRGVCTGQDGGAAGSGRRIGGRRADSIGYRGPDPRSRSRPTPISSCISSKARSWSGTESRSASSPARRRRSGTTRVMTGQDSHAGTTPAQRAQGCAGRRGTGDRPGGPHDARPRRGRARHGGAALRPCPTAARHSGEVRFSVEFRHPDEAEIGRLAAQFPREAGFIARDAGVTLELTELFRIPAQPFDPACVGAGAVGGGEARLFRAGHRLRRGARRRVRRPARADGDDLHPLQGRPVPATRPRASSPAKRRPGARCC